MRTSDARGNRVSIEARKEAAWKLSMAPETLKVPVRAVR